MANSTHVTVDPVEAGGQHWPTAWAGQWIGTGAAGSAELDGFAGDRRAGFHRVLFRRRFDLPAVPATAPARITADARYALFVNGTRVGDGPPRSQPRRLRYDCYDLAPFLTAGSNVVAAIVTYYGEPTSFWEPAAPSGSLGGDAALVFEARLGAATLVSDERWQVRDCAAWSAFGRGPLDGVPAVRVDAGRLPEDWLGPDAADGAFGPAAPLGPAHLGTFGRTRPPTDPYGALLPALVGPRGGADVAPAVIGAASVAGDRDWTAASPAALVQQVLAADPATAAGRPARLPFAADIDGTHAAHLRLDFGRVVVGFVALDVDAPAGTTLELHYRERPVRPGPIDPISPQAGTRYVCRGNADRYTTLEVYGLRYLHLLVHGPAPARVTVRDIHVREHVYPWTGAARFDCNDAEIARLYRAGIQTVRLNSLDSFTDCPTREQRAWVGDGVVHQMVHLTTNADWRLARTYVHLGNSPRADGILPMAVAGDIEFGRGATIPDWSLHWVHGVHNLYRYLGDRDEILGLLPTVERVLRWFTPFVDERGTLRDLPEWNLVDWSSVFTFGRTSIVTALWARALREYAELADWVGNAGSASWARSLHHAAERGFEDFWDDARGTYVDHIVAGERRPAASQAAGAAAVVSGLAPRSRWPRVVAAITDRATLVVRSWIGGGGGYDPERIAAQLRREPVADWDVEREIVRAEPFFSYVVHDAIAAAGRAGDLVDIVRDWSTFLTDGYDTFGECWGWGTPVHGWSSTPTRDLVMRVAGITPAAPGYARARVAPRLGPLTDLTAVTPTPAGDLTLTVAGASAVHIDSPVPVTFAPPGGADVALAAGSHDLRLPAPPG